MEKGQRGKEGWRERERERQTHTHTHTHRPDLYVDMALGS